MAKRRRGQGEGSIYLRADGRWCGLLNLGYVNGKRRRKVIYGRTRKEVVEKLTALLREQQQGFPITTERQTVAQFLTRWLEDTVRPKLRPASFRAYEQVARNHLIPALGRYQLTKLTPQHVQTMLRAKEAELSATSVQQLRAVLRAALRQAEKWSLVARNVATLVDVPAAVPYAGRVLSIDEARRLLVAARGDPLEALYHVALTLGLRRGEALGLRWQDIDLDGRTLQVAAALQRVNHVLTLVEPKTKQSRRTLPLTPALITVLRAHRTRQLEARLLAGVRWEDYDLVFPTRNGRPMEPSWLVVRFKELLRRADLPPMRFHDLRHSCASFLSAQGVPVRVAMDILGHTNIATTQNIYTHVFDEAKREAADAIERLLEVRDDAI